ncbi:hypothetical protein ASE80_27460 [Pseudomonas sp. Leaf15]|uniref:hypothetical protein n=1 Tax=unclassified Pseudomonas TaxID=196821 RepID=UPI00070244AC|nr:MULTISPECIES: hypothetical protein [unclassified Pseudomonas]KQM51914.1 hypothetical protein ASE80_27460 [Pseudomonas sp. Leaf15]RAH01440.1 hypothetical protein DJ480_17630 [Pseudomonas sp. Leaf98]
MVFEYIGMGAGIVMILSFPLFSCAMFKKLDAAERYVEGSAYIAVHRGIFRHAPFDGRPQRLVAMAIIILAPRIFQWRRLVRVEDVENIPRYLKYWMVIPTLVAFTSVTVMCISWLLI